MVTTGSTITRFAPSPTGLLHIGHAASAWFAWNRAQETGGTFLLRIEDIDTARCRPEFETAIYEDLKWLGLDWPLPVRRQSDHFGEYQSCLNKLDEAGLLYPCFCTRKQIEDEIARSPSAPHGPEGALYPGTCRTFSKAEREDKIGSGIPHALRLDVAKATSMTGPLRWRDLEKGWQDAKPETLGDVVLARKDTPVSYHLCVTHDDALQGVTLVTRGEDLFPATHIHRLLQALLGYETPEYCHHPLLRDASGQRFAKRNKSVTLRSLKERDFSPEELSLMIHSGYIPDFL
jgi:glutamyl-Q tRNA(Asp) synthetase